MTEFDHNIDGVKVLYRMIAYVRDEALRLRIMDVAILLEHAEDAVVAFTPIRLAEQGNANLRDRTSPDH